MRTPRSRLALLGVVLALALTGAACSSDDESSSPTGGGSTDGPSGPACGEVPAEGEASFDGSLVSAGCLRRCVENKTHASQCVAKHHA